MSIKNYIIGTIAGLTLMGCTTTERWPEPPIVEKPKTTQATKAPETEPQKLMMQVPFAYRFDTPATRNIFNGLVKLITKKENPTPLETLVIAANIGKDGLLSADELTKFCQEMGGNPEYIPSVQNIAHSEQLDVTDVPVTELLKMLEAIKAIPKPAEVKPTPAEPPKPTEYSHKVGVSYENEQVKALANGYVSAMIALDKKANEKAPDTPEVRMKIYRSIAGTDGKITECELESRISEHVSTVEQLKADGQKYEDLVIKAQYAPQDPDSIEIKVTMPEDQVARIKELISKYKPDDMDVYQALKKYSKEQEKDGKKSLVMTVQDVDALATDWEAAYQ